MKTKNVSFFAVIFFVTMILQLAFCCFWFSEMKQYCVKFCDQCNTVAEVQTTETKPDKPTVEEIVVESSVD